MSRFRRMGLIIGLALLVALVYAPSALVYGEQWGDFRNLTYTHGWLILAVCAALVLRSHREIAAATGGPWPPALLALAACIFCWLVCYRASIQDAHITIFPAIFWLAAAAAFGRAVGRLLVFPVAFFYFAVPSWSQLSMPLQSLTVVAMRVLLGITGPQALILGDRIQIAGGTFVVEEGCSGLHFMIVGLAVAALHGELRRDPLKVRAAQLALMAALALLANWLRVYVIIQAGYLTHMHSTLLRNHYWFGWGVFAVALVVFFTLSARFESAPASESAPADSAPADLSAAPGAARADVTGLAMTVAVLVALPAASFEARRLHPAAALTAPLDTDPRDAWTPALVDIHSSWQPRFHGDDQQQRLAFVNAAGDTVEVFTVRYRNQRQDTKLVAMGNSLAGSQLVTGPEATVATPAGDFRETEVAELEPPHYVYLIWSRYRSAGHDFARPLPAQLWYGLNATVSNPSAGLLAFRSACRPDCGSARRVLQDFSVSAVPR
jgi:exosortase